MPLIYKEAQDSRPDKNGNYLWRPILAKTGTMIESRKLGKFISAECSVTEADTMAVLLSLARVMNLHLLNGNSVRLEGLGTFTIRTRSRGKGVLTKEEVNPSQINGLACIFTPEYTRSTFQGTTRSLYDGATFVHISKLHKMIEENTTPGGDGEDDKGGYVDPTT